VVRSMPKIKIEKMEPNLMYCSIDDRPARKVEDGEVIEFKESVGFCGNPIDPWRINFVARLVSE